MAEIQEVTNENFNDLVIAADKPVLVDFFATWCGPCKMLNPIMESLSGEVGDSIIVAKCDIDKCMELAQDYGLKGVPTIVMFKDGIEVERAFGFRQKTQLLEMVQKVLE